MNRLIIIEDAEQSTDCVSPELESYRGLEVYNTDINRIELIHSINPDWACQLIEFVSGNPEFEPYLRVCPLTPPATKAYPDLKTVKEQLVYYVCYAGVNTNYGKKLYELVKAGNLDVLSVKKRATIDAVMALPEINDLEVFNTIKIKGVGLGAMDFVRKNMFSQSDITFPTDRVFQRGLCKIYGLPKVTVTQAKRIVDSWKGDKAIGNIFCFQVAHYV